MKLKCPRCQHEITIEEALAQADKQGVNVEAELKKALRLWPVYQLQKLLK